MYNIGAKKILTIYSIIDINQKGGLGMIELSKNVNHLDADFGKIFAYPSVLRSLHWFKKGAPPGL